MYKYKHASFLKFAVSDSEYFGVINVQILVNTLRSLKIVFEKEGENDAGGRKIQYFRFVPGRMHALRQLASHHHVI